MQELLRGRHIELPADPYQRVALFEQEIIAEFGRCARVLRTLAEIEHIQQAFAAPVRNLEQCGAVAFGWIARLQDVEVSRKLDLAVRRAWREIDVGDDPVGCQLGIDSEIGLRENSLVGTSRADGGAVEDVGPLHHLDVSDSREACESKKERENRNASKHETNFSWLRRASGWPAR